MACLGCGLVAAGADEAVAKKPVDKLEAQRAIQAMKSSLKAWLRFRKKNDDIVAGKVKTKFPTAVATQRVLQGRDWAGEQRVANDLYALLSELYDARMLPSPNLATNQNAAVQLAEIVITGKLPNGATAPVEQGLIPLIVLGGLGFAYLAYSRKVAGEVELQKEKERLACIRAGACTDYGFWLKWGAIGLVGFLVYANRDKIMGAVKRAKKGG